MALFKKKEAKSKVDEALELFNSLSDEELEEFLSKADLDGDGDVDEEDAEETTEETTEPSEETTEPTKDAEILEPEDPEMETKIVTFLLPDNGRAYVLNIRLKGADVIEPKTIQPGETTITLELTGVGTQEYTLYIDGNLLRSEKVTFIDE